MKPIQYILFSLIGFLLPTNLLAHNPLHECSWVIHGVINGVNINDGGAPTPAPGVQVRARSRYSSNFPFGIPWFETTTDANGAFSIQSREWLHADCHMSRDVEIQVLEWGWQPVTSPSNGLYFGLDGNNPDFTSGSSWDGFFQHYTLPFDAFYSYFIIDGPDPEDSGPGEEGDPEDPGQGEGGIVDPRTGTWVPVDPCMENHPMIPRPDFILESINMGPDPSDSNAPYRNFILSLGVRNIGDFAYSFSGPCMSETEIKVRFDYDRNFSYSDHEVMIPIPEMLANTQFEAEVDGRLRGTNNSLPPELWVDGDGIPNGYRYVRITIDLDHDRSQQFWGRIRELSEINNIYEACYDTDLSVQNLVDLGNCSPRPPNQNNRENRPGDGEPKRREEEKERKRKEIEEESKRRQGEMDRRRKEMKDGSKRRQEEMDRKRKEMKQGSKRRQEEMDRKRKEIEEESKRRQEEKDRKRKEIEEESKRRGEEKDRKRKELKKESKKEKR